MGMNNTCNLAKKMISATETFAKPVDTLYNNMISDEVCKMEKLFSATVSSKYGKSGKCMTKHRRKMQKKRAKTIADAYESKQNKRMELTIILSRPKIGLIRKHIVLAEICQRNAKELERMDPFLRRIEMNQMGRRVM